MRRGTLALAALALCAGCSAERLPTNSTGPDHPPLVMAFETERPPSPPFSTDLWLYDFRTGGSAINPPNLNTTSIEGPCALSGDGRLMAFFTDRQPTGSTASLMIYDVAKGNLRIPAKINELWLTAPNPALSADGRFLAAQYQIGGPFDQWVAVQDLVADSLLLVPNLNDPNATNWDPSLNGDGTLLTLTSNRFGSVGGWDIFLYSVPGDTLIPLPGLNSAENELSSSISADGRYIAFQRGHADSPTLIDVFVYDRTTRSLLPMPGANTDLADFQPCISRDGRYVAYQTEKTGAGDIRVYDLREQRLLQLEGLNADGFRDAFPALASP